MQYEQMVENESDNATRAAAATAQGAQSFDRLVSFTERASSGQAHLAASFIGMVIGRARFDIYDLRRLDTAIADDVLICMDCIRWGRNALPELVPDGQRRAENICFRFELSSFRNSSLSYNAI